MRCPRRRGCRPGRRPFAGWPGRLKSWKRTQRVESGAASAMASTRCRRGARCSVEGDDEGGLLEARIETGEVGDVGAVLPVGPHDEVVVAPILHAGDQAFHPFGVDGCGAAARSRASRSPEGRRRRARHAALRCHPSTSSGSHGVGADEPATMIADSPASSVIHGPSSLSGHWIAELGLAGVTETEMQPAELTPGMSTTHGDLVDERTVAHAHLDPRSDAVDVGRRLAQPDGDRVAHRSGASTSPAPTLRHTVTGSARSTTTRSSSPSRLRSTRARAPGTFVARRCPPPQPLPQRPVGLADQQVARITSGEFGLRLDVAFGDEQVEVAVVVDVGELARHAVDGRTLPPANGRWAVAPRSRAMSS